MHCVFHGIRLLRLIECDLSRDRSYSNSVKQYKSFICICLWLKKREPAKDPFFFVLKSLMTLMTNDTHDTPEFSKVDTPLWASSMTFIVVSSLRYSPVSGFCPFPPDNCDARRMQCGKLAWPMLSRSSQSHWSSHCQCKIITFLRLTSSQLILIHPNSSILILINLYSPHPCHLTP